MTTSLTTLRPSALDLALKLRRFAGLRFTGETRHVVRHLADLDDYLLADIGIARSEIHDVIASGRKPSLLSSSHSNAA